MNTLSHLMAQSVCGGMVSFGGVSSTKIRILVTDDSEFRVPSILNGHQINAIFYANNVTSMDGTSLTTDLAVPFSHHGHLFHTEAIDSGHIYTIYFNQG